MVRVAVAVRGLAALAVVSGLWLTAAPPAAPRPAVEKAGYRVLAVDLHVHSFPGDGLLPPWDLAIEASRRRLDAVALTNHNSTHSWRLAQWLAPVVPHRGALLIPGEELTSVGYHLALVGLTSPIDWRQSAAAAAVAAHARGAVAIAAHPSRSTWGYLDDTAIAALDGVEAAHPMVLVNETLRRGAATYFAHALLVHPGLAAIGSSDFHHFAPMGLGRTYVFARDATADGILDAVRAGRTVACDGRGVASGPEGLLALVKDDCRRDARARPDGETRRERAGTGLVWLGLAALVLLGRGEAALE